MARWGALALALLQMKTQELTVRNLLSRTGTGSPKLALPPSFSFLGHHSALRVIRGTGPALEARALKPALHYLWALTCFCGVVCCAPLSCTFKKEETRN